MLPVKYWEIVADKLTAAGWTWGYAARSRATAGAGPLTPIGETVGVTLSILTSCSPRFWNWKRRYLDEAVPIRLDK